MPQLPLKTRIPATRHLTAIVMLLALFALPFHFHAFTSNAQLAQECSCSQGLRVHAVLTPAPTDWAPLLETAFVHDFEPQLFSRLAIDSRSIRAPPSL